MAKLERAQQRLSSIFTKVQSFYRKSRVNVEKIRHALKIGAYWGAVSVIGIVIAVVILQVNHVPVIQPAYAGPGSWVGTLVGSLLYYTVIGPIGAASIVVAFIMQMVIQYPYGAVWSTTGMDGSGAGFVNVGAVQTGWKLVRDVCNMFFSLILVIIALATVLKIEAYSWKQMLPKLVLMAVLINFSKTICGIFTDFATVAMATFGGSFTKSFATGIIGAFGMTSLKDISASESSTTQDNSVINVTLAYVAAAMMTMVFFVVMLSFTVTLLFRIIMLWFLIVLSPLAYIARILPQTKKYSSQWWEMFGRYVTVGPLVTFFLWLSLTMAFGTTVGSSSASGNPIGTGFTTDAAKTSLSSTGYTPPEGAFTATSPNQLANFLIATMMLMASLKLIHQMAAEAGKLTGAVEGAAGGVAMAAMTFPGRQMQNFGAGLGEGQKYHLGENGEQVFEGNKTLSNRLYDLTHRATAIKDENGKITGYKENAGRFAKAATFLGSTVFQPVDAYKTAAEGLKKYSEEKKMQAHERAHHAADAMAKEKVHGKEGSKLSIVSNIAGILAGAGLDGKHIVDQYFSGTGLLRGLGKASHILGGTEKEAEDLEGQAEAAKKELVDETNRLSKDNAPLAAEDYKTKEDQAKKMGDAQTAIEKGEASATLDFALPEVQSAFEAHIKQMETKVADLQNAGLTNEAGKVTKEIEALKTRMATKVPLTLGEMTSSFTGGSSEQDIKDVFGGAYKARKDEAVRQRDNIKKRLAASGWDETTRKFNGTSFAAPETIVDAAGNVVTNPRSKKGLAAIVEEKESKAKQLRDALLSYEAGDSYEARKHTDHMISEEMSKLKDVKNTDELKQHLTRAIREKNHPKAEALLKLIAKNYDFNEIIQQGMADAGYKDASSDADGLELWRKEVLVKQLGMGEHESYRVANDISYIEEGVGHIQTGRAYEMVNGHLHFVPKERRAKIVAGEMRKASINDKLKWNRLGWGREDAERKFQLTESGIQILLTDAQDMAKERKWENMDSNAKLNLSEPRIVEELRARGVDAKFIQNLEDYWRTVGKFAAQGAPRAGVSQFATWEEHEQPAHH